MQWYFIASPTKRLKLLPVTEYAADNTSLPPYFFAYTTNNLPPRLSTKQDHWGYANANTSNKLIPVNPDFLNDVNRKADAAGSQGCLLNKITYPTGGSTDFEYEVHKAGYLQNTTKPINDSTITLNTVPLDANQIGSTSSQTLQQTVNITQTQNVKIRWRLCPNDPSSSYVRITDLSNISNPIVFNGQPQPNCNAYQETYRILDPGNYKLEVFAEAGVWAYLSIEYRSTVSQNTYLTVGGVRIKKITQNDGVGGPAIVKNYEYVDLDNPARSSGILITKPVYKFIARVTRTCDTGPGLPVPVECSYIGLSSSGKAPLGMSHGSHIVYKNVTEKIGTANEGGKTEYTYTYADEGGSSSYPFGPATSRDWQRGLLSVQTDYAFDSGTSTYIQKRRKTIDYNFRSDNAKNCNVADGYIVVFNPSGPIVFPVPSNGFAVRTYNVISRWYSISKETLLQDGITTERNFTYDETNGYHTLPTQVIAKNSDGKDVRTTNIYSKDQVSSTDPAIVSLIAKNILVPLEIRNEYGTASTSSWTLQGGKKTSFFNFTLGITPNTFLCPLEEKLYDILPNNTNDLKLTIQEYNSDGFVKKLLTSGYTTPEEYTWTNGLLTQKKYGAFIENFTWYPNRKLLKTRTSVDGQLSEFNYDGFLRLNTLKERFNGSTACKTTTMTYNYGGVANPANNFTETSTSFTDPGQTNFTQKGRSYVDGLGRDRENVLANYSPTLKDVAQKGQTYDALGRIKRNYRPVLGTTSGTMPFITLSGAYEEFEYENSALNRVTKTTKLPENFISTVVYGTNVSNEVLKHDPTGAGATSYFNANELYKSTATDPNGNVAIVFTDKLNRTVLSRRLLTTTPGVTYADTYYVYDDIGNLVYVVPPGAPNTASALCFKYQYDSENRLWKKTIPNAGLTEMAYDARDRVIATREANLTAQGKWLRVDYDDYDRPVKTGFSTTSTGTIAAADQLSALTYGSATNELDKVKTTAIKVLNNTGVVTNTAATLNTTYNYDTWGRMTSTTANNHFGNAVGDNTTNTYPRISLDWLGSTSRAHTSPYGNKTILQAYTYDNFGRTLNQSYKVDNFGAANIANNGYDYRDQLITKYLHYGSGLPPTWLQEINYQYNNWGWLTQINDPDAGLAGSSALTICAGTASASYSPPCAALGTPVPPHNGAVAIGNIKGFLALSKEAARKDNPQNPLLSVQYDVYLPDGQVNTVRDFRYLNAAESPWSDGAGNAALTDTIFWALPDSIVLSLGHKQVAIEAFETTIAQKLLDNGLLDAAQAKLQQQAVAGFISIIGQAEGETAAATNPPTPVAEDLFHLRLYYETANASLNAGAQKNGNISWMTWRVAGRDRQLYGFSYDKLDRLTAAKYAEQNASGTYRLDNLFGTSGVQYDARGNIKTLQNVGVVQNGACYDVQGIDNLTYTYDLSNTGNKLLSVSDATGNARGFKPGGGAGYAYDANGNLISDSYKGIISILYNHLNLPYKITFSTGNTIEWVYDANGKKLRKLVKQGATTVLTQDYSSDIEYKNGVLEAMYHAEGRVKMVNNTPKYEYVLRDHLGNGRVYFSDSNADGIGSMADISQDNHYYPFGLNIEDPRRAVPAAGSASAYQYNNKEFNEDWGLNWSDYGARFYDAAVGRWWSVDAMAEKYRRWSPYNYGVDNPIRFIDPDGHKVENIIIGYSIDMTQVDRDKYNSAILSILNNLTNDNLSIQNGQIVIFEKHTGNKKAGTALIRGFVEGFIKDGKKINRDVTIVKNSGKPEMDNATTIVDPNSNPIDASNGMGADSRIEYDPDNPDNIGYYSGVEKSKKQGTPEMVLAHELIHAFRIAFGKRDVSSCTSCKRSITNEEAVVQQVIRKIFSKENDKIPQSENPYKDE